ncbi:MAG: WG repeat-containing protein [Roseburia sp.]|nr:WG repeat-containing protein [Roseburia sp.]
MEKNKRWKRVTALFLIAIAVFGVAEDSRNREQTFNEMQGQMTDTEIQIELAQTGLNSQEAAERDIASEDASEQETESEDISEQETESEDDITVSYLLHEGTQCICKGGKYGFIDSDGETVIPFMYDDAALFVERLAYFSMGGDYGFMDEAQTPVFYLDCDSVSNFK